MRFEALIAGGGGPDISDLAQLIAANVETVLPHLERLGIVTADEVGSETLAQRMMDEAAATNSILVAQSNVGAWCVV